VAAAGLAALALTGGLAAAGLARAFGIAFSGSPRSAAAEHAHEQPAGMLAPMIALSALSVFLGVFPRAPLRLVAPVIAQLGADPALLAEPAAQAARAGAIALAFLALCAALFALRNRALSRRAPATSATWGCGYPVPAPSMQYTATSFSAPLVAVVRSALVLERTGEPPGQVFPRALAHEDSAADKIEISAYRRGLAWAAEKLAAIRALHRPSIHQYVVYLFVALIVLLSYAARLGRT
ncbi:MAG TPA: hypothetical protein VF945_12340, partial [Polyangia bacterium]